MIGSVLIANRGEIAVRILKTCTRLGIRTVAVYTDVDARALHVAHADDAIRIDFYLNQEAILAAARQSGAAAIHPGYGFLAENADFAQAVLDAGAIWVGPPPAAMRALGDKARAKAVAVAQRVPILPGYHGADQSPEILAAEAARIGYPVLIKATAGGGGRGMRVVDAAHELEEALQAARREARASFGDDRVLLERYVPRPRHIEIQIIGDLHGNLIHLGERECSIQRRNQKLIEETPSPVVDAALRARMGEAALRLARAAGYANAGTVEFLLDPAGEFAFLEVNARLQVEHPVTEAVTGLDLVELQLRVADGQRLPIGQDQVMFTGHAIEARVIAEDALAGFLPSSGRIDSVVWPGADARVDTWIEDGSVVSPFYDSLLAKVIAHGPDRAAAITRLSHALRETWIDGVSDNVDLLLATLEHPAFRAGELDTAFLGQYQVVESLAEAPAAALAAVSAIDFLHPPTDAADPWRNQTGWRVGRVAQPATWSRAGRPHSVSVSADPAGDGVIVETASRYLSASLLRMPSPAESRLSIDGRTLTVWNAPRGRGRVAEWDQRTFRFTRPGPLTIEATAGERTTADSAGGLRAPMPGRVVRVNVRPGEHVVQNQPLIVLEAMKMEHVVDAPHAGVVTEVLVEEGQQVASGARLLDLGSVAVE